MFSLINKTKILFIFLYFTTNYSFADYPNGPVKFIVPWYPGDFESVLTEIIAENWKNETGMKATVLNRFKGNVPWDGVLEVLNAPADGSVIGSFLGGIQQFGPLMDIGIEKDSFEPIGIFLTYPFVLATLDKNPYKNLKELSEHAKSNNVVFGHLGSGLVPTKSTLAAAKKLGFEFSNVIETGFLDCDTLTSGEADVINTTFVLIESCLDQINILASIGEKRINKIPNVETISEQTGINNIEMWNGLFVKKGTPQEIKDKIEKIAKKAILDEVAQELMKMTGARVYWQGQNSSKERLEADTKKLAELNALLQY